MSDTVESEERRLSDSESDQIWEENIYMSGCNVVFRARDSKGISKLTRIRPILPYKISCIKGTSEIPFVSLD